MGHRGSSDNTKPVVCRKGRDRSHRRPSAGRGSRLTSVSKLRWGDQVPADVDAARQRLLDAAETCIDRYGLAKTTVEDIATTAKVSRATIYRYFDNRDELMLAVVLRSLDRSQDPHLDEFFTTAETPEQFATALVE